MKKLSIKLILASILTSIATHITLSRENPVNGNPVAGKEKAIICIGCHGRDGNSTNPEYPKLAGQVPAYLYKQIFDFKKGLRKDETMSSMALSIDDKDVADVVVFFSNQKPKKPMRKTLKTNLLGKTIYHNGIKLKNVAACASCHGKNGLGHPKSRYPALAGQHTDYLVKALKKFKSGIRRNDLLLEMRNITAKLTETEIEAVAAYIANLKWKSGQL